MLCNHRARFSHDVAYMQVGMTHYTGSRIKGTAGWFGDQFFRVFEVIIFCFVVAICDLVHDLEALFHIPLLLTASGNLF